MAIGTYGSYGAKYQGYQLGSHYKQQRLTMGQYMRKQALANYQAQIFAAGPLMFGQLASASEQVSILAVQRLQSRIAEEAKAKRQVLSIRI